MKERPILFQGEMVRAVLNGRKTQTRRVVKQKDNDLFDNDGIPIGGCPYGQVGDELWVRETFREWNHLDMECGCSDHCYCYRTPPTPYCYRADGHEIFEEDRELGVKWKPSIFMPRKASRIQLRITDIRVERLHDISSQDCLAEGVDNYVEFCELWVEINGQESWENNPWLWVVEFERIRP